MPAVDKRATDQPDADRPDADRPDAERNVRQRVERKVAPMEVPRMADGCVSRAHTCALACVLDCTLTV